MSEQKKSEQKRSPFDETFERMKNRSSKEIAKILIDAYKDGLLTICGAFFSPEDVNECEVALSMALLMLQNNDLSLKNKEER